MNTDIFLCLLSVFIRVHPGLILSAPPPNTTSFVVVQHGRTLAEWGQKKPHYTASLAKAIVGGTSLAIAMDDGRIRPDDLASKSIPAWRGDPLKSKITIRQLATHSSGIEDAEQDAIPHMQLPGWKGRFWRREPDPFTPAIHDAPVLFPPGTRFAYSNPGMAALSYAISASLGGADLKTMLRDRVYRPAGISDDEWSIGYGRAYEVDGLRLYANWGGGSFTPRAVAKIGEWMMRRGVRYAGTPLPDRTKDRYAPGCGLGWYTNFDKIWPALPADAFAGAGAGHQLLLVVPSLELVVVRMGDRLSATEEFWTAAYQHVFEPALKALPPYPPGRITVSFAPESTIVRQAIGSDNWPITWADDGQQYTAYGDGWGFEPRVDRKLSLGFARVEGDAAAFRGVNIRSESGERLGDGRSGLKASGILMVDGVLYMWVRNAGNAQLAWSADHGRTWQWGFRFETSFGSPAFLNFGRDYAGARDGYVYTYSQDGPSAYDSDDGLVLARAPRRRLRERGAWEFYVRPGVWTNHIRECGQVFRYAGHCQRVDAVYHPGLKRYLLALGYNHDGGWGIFDAPEPWGPWTTAFHTGDWGLGGTHGYRLPAKWIGGTSMYLVFSGAKGNDAFCVRALTMNASAAAASGGAARAARLRPR